MALRYKPVSICPPHCGLNAKKQPVQIWVIHLLEEHPAQGEEPIEWFLLTSVKIDSDQQAGNRGQENTDQLKSTLSEQQLALEQWLKRIPDDPGGLLRRKFAWQFRQRERQLQQQQNW